MGSRHRDATQAVGGEPDPEALRFLRLSCLAGADAFLLEPIFSNEFWGFLAEPVSRENEAALLDRVVAEATAARDGLLEPVAGDR